MKPNQFAHITDQELLDHFYRDHDNQWLGVLLQRYTLLLLGVCMKYLKNEEEAKDAVQQIFLKCITELHKYKVDFFKSWLYMVAKNHCLMKLRDKTGKNTTELKDNLVSSDDEIADKKIHVEKDNLLERMNVCLHELNSEQKECVTLFYLEKKSYQEIADRTGHTMMQVKSHIQNGKRNLKILLQKGLKN